MKRRNDSGFSLLEIMIAIVIAAAVTGVIVVGVLGAQRINTHSQEMREASNLAEEKIEQLRRLNFGSIDSGADSVGHFYREWTVTEISTKPRIKQLELIIKWHDSKDRLHTTTYNTTFYRNAYPYKS